MSDLVDRIEQFLLTEADVKLKWVRGEKLHLATRGAGNTGISKVRYEIDAFFSVTGGDEKDVRVRAAPSVEAIGSGGYIGGSKSAQHYKLQWFPLTKRGEDMFYRIRGFKSKTYPGQVYRNKGDAKSAAEQTVNKWIKHYGPGAE